MGLDQLCDKADELADFQTMKIISAFGTVELELKDVLLYLNKHDLEMKMEFRQQYCNGCNSQYCPFIYEGLQILG